jgi:hypothetical protein
MEWLAGAIVLLGVIWLALRGKKSEGTIEARLEQSNNNTEALKKNAKITEHYRAATLADARDSMRDKVRKHKP